MKQVPRGPEELNCPQWQKPMSEVCHKCPKWIQVRGKNPNTGQEVDEWNCADALLPMLPVSYTHLDREMQKFIALAGSSQMDPKLREQLIDNAIKEFEAGQKIRRQRIEQIKSRNYSPNASPGVQGGTYTYNPATGELEPQ